MENFKERARNFRRGVSRRRFNPSSDERKINQKLNLELAKLFKGTANEKLMAFTDPMLRELIEFGCQGLKDDIKRVNKSSFPVEIEGRYKSFDSTQNKVIDWGSRKEKDGKVISDYLAIRIYPTSEHSVFNAKGDKNFQALIDEREATREFIKEQYAKLSSDMTFLEYCKMCEQILNRISNQYPNEARKRKAMYEEKVNTVYNNYQEFAELNGDFAFHMSLEEILENTEVNVEDLLSELQEVNPNKCILYKLEKDTINAFENSPLLKSLGFSIEYDDSERTKFKYSERGYISKFLGVNLTITLEDRNCYSFANRMSITNKATI